MHHDRFICQNRYDPPSGFPLISIWDLTFMLCIFSVMRGQVEIMGLHLMDRTLSRTNNFTQSLCCFPNSSCCKLWGKCYQVTCRKNCTVLFDQIQQVQQAEFPEDTLRTPLFRTTQFHILFNFLFKVLFNLPSRYLFAICLRLIFRLMRRLWSV